MTIQPKKILIMGLPGSGKTYLAERLAPKIDAVHINADKVRAEANDWDFSPEGRIRQAERMAKLADEQLSQGKHVLVDFVCPTTETRARFNPDLTIWIDTIDEGRFEDTNRVFEKPVETEYDFKVTDQTEGDFWAAYLAKRINGSQWDTKHPTTQLLGRWQPWHEGHRALFDRAIRKTGQVVVMVRDCHGLGDNPFVFEDVRDRIKEDLDGTYIEGVDYVVHHVPNIVHITYGRTVGYTIEQEHLGEELESVSATKKREELRANGELRKP